MTRYTTIKDTDPNLKDQQKYDPNAFVRLGVRIPLDFTLKDYPAKEDQMATEKTLYEIKRGDETLFGNKLVINSQGQWVMEIKGSGDVVAVDKATVSEVIQYTIGIKFSQQGQIYNYFNEEKDLVKGDALVVAGSGSSVYQVALVVAVDTKSKEATREIIYYKKF